MDTMDLMRTQKRSRELRNGVYASARVPTKVKMIWPTVGATVLDVKVEFEDDF
jgi:hypothetical protein